MARKNETMRDEEKVPSEKAGTTRVGEEGFPPEAAEPDGEALGQGTGSEDDAALEEFLAEGGMQSGEVSAPEEGRGPDGGLEKEVETLQEDLIRLQDQHLRLAADFENYRKRVSAELASGWVRAQAELARTLLEGLDDLQRVSRFTSEDATLDALIEGVDLVERKLLKALTDAGLQAVDPSGETFDPNTMEAMMRVPAEGDGQDDTVHQVFQKGYLFKDQLIRPARVSVYKDDD